MSDVVVVREPITRIVVAERDGAVIVRGAGAQGPPGPQGPPGADGADGADGAPGAGGLRSVSYSFASPLTVWPVPHGLGTKALEVLLFEPDGVTEKDGDVRYLDDDTVEVHWFYAETGVLTVLY